VTIRNSVEGIPQQFWLDKVHQFVKATHIKLRHSFFLRRRWLGDIAQMRWLLLEQTGSAISTPLLLVVVFWLAIIFLSFGLFAPSNGTVIAALMIAAFSVSCAVLLILELDRPFDGLIQISSEPMRNSLRHLGQ
jgi:hypothetical protein